MREPITKLYRKKINALMILDSHARDIIGEFVRDSILDAREFAWESILRFYFRRSANDIKIEQCTGEFDYGYEYDIIAPEQAIWESGCKMIDSPPPPPPPAHTIYLQIPGAQWAPGHHATHRSLHHDPNASAHV